MLIPIGSSTKRYVGAGIGYAEDTGDFGYEDRVIRSFVRLHVPSLVPDTEVVDTGEEGDWPGYRSEMFTPGGGLVPIMPTPGDR